MQRKWVKHIKIKKEIFEKFEDMWSKQVIRLNEREKEYKEMGIAYN